MLDARQLGDYIDSRFTKSLFRLETLDMYDVASNGDDLDRYLAGEPGPDPARKGPWLDHIRGEVARGLRTHRVHVLRSPLTGYLRFEIEWGYLPNVEAGEHVYILDLAERPRPPLLDVDHDFWLIDDRDVVRMHYDDEGRYTGAEILGAGALPRYQAARDAALGAAEPVGAYWARHPEYHQVNNP